MARPKRAFVIAGRWRAGWPIPVYLGGAILGYFCPNWGAGLAYDYILGERAGILRPAPWQGADSGWGARIFADHPSTGIMGFACGPVLGRPGHHTLSLPKGQFTISCPAWTGMAAGGNIFIGPTFLIP